VQSRSVGGSLSFVWTMLRCYPTVGGNSTYDAKRSITGGMPWESLKGRKLVKTSLGKTWLGLIRRRRGVRDPRERAEGKKTQKK